MYIPYGVDCDLALPFADVGLDVIDPGIMHDNSFCSGCASHLRSSAPGHGVHAAVCHRRSGGALRHPSCAACSWRPPTSGAGGAARACLPMEKPADGKGEALGSKNRLWLHCPGLLESQLTEYFNQFGPVLDLYIPRDRQ